MNPKVKARYNPSHKKWIVPSEHGGYKIVHSFDRPEHAICGAPEYFTYEMEPYFEKIEGINGIIISRDYFVDHPTGCIRANPNKHEEHRISDLKEDVGQHVIDRIIEEVNKIPSKSVTETFHQEVIPHEKIEAIKSDIRLYVAGLQSEIAKDHQSQIAKLSAQIKALKEAPVRKWVVPSSMGSGYSIINSVVKPQDAYCEAPSSYTEEMSPFLVVKEIISGGAKVFHVEVSPEYVNAKKTSERLAREDHRKNIEGLHDALFKKAVVSFHNNCNPIQRFAYSIIGPRIHNPGKIHPVVKLIFGKKLEGFSVGGEYES